MISFKVSDTTLKKNVNMAHYPSHLISPQNTVFHVDNFYTVYFNTYLRYISQNSKL